MRYGRQILRYPPSTREQPASLKAKLDSDISNYRNLNPSPPPPLRLLMMGAHLLLPARRHVGTGAVAPAAAGPDDVYTRLLDAATRVVEPALQRDLQGNKGSIQKLYCINV